MSIIGNKIEWLLQRGTKFLGLDLKYLISGATWLTVGQGFTTLFGLLLTIAFANLLPKETFGLYRYILSLAGILSIFTLTGMNSAVTQAVASGNEGALRSSVKFQLKWNLMTIAATLSVAVYYFWNGNPIIAASLSVLAFAMPLTSAFNTYSAFLVGKRNFRLDNLLGILSTGIYALGMFLALLLTREIWILVLVYALTTLGANIFFYIKTLRIYKPPETKSRDVIKYGKQLTFIGFISPIVNQIDKIVLNHFWGPIALATYFLARAIPDRAYSFIKSLISVAFPKVAQRNIEEIDKVIWKRIFQGMILGLVLAGGYIIVAPVVFKYLLPKYLESVHYSQILSLIFIFAAPARYLGIAFTTKKMVRPAVIANLIANTFKIILYVILGIWSGIMGLIITEIIFQAAGLGINITLWKLESSKSSKYLNK